MAAYAFHSLVLSQALLILPGGHCAVGWDSVVGCPLFVGWWWWKWKTTTTTAATTTPTPTRASTTTTTTTNKKHTTTTLPWKLPNSNDGAAWVRFRLSFLVAIVALVRSYFWTGKWSLFWEDCLYELSAKNLLPLTLPVFRSLQVLLGHLSWVSMGSLILAVVPRPPGFFLERYRDWQWFQLCPSSTKDDKESSSSSSWLWWSIGGYYVSSWLFNVADTMNQWVLPVQMLESASESVVSQLVRPEYNDKLASILGYVAPCISAPVWEEVLYRGFLLSGLSSATGSPLFANLVQCVIFSIHHMSVTGALPLAVLGFAWAVLYKQSRSLLTVMIVHSLWNSRIFFGSWFGL